MNNKAITQFFRRYLCREGFIYILVFAIAFCCVNVSAVEESIKIRKLNDVLMGIDTSQLYAFSNGEIPASQVDWQRLTNYFHTILNYFPKEEDAELFLGFCEYYGLNQQDQAAMHIMHSADNVPYLFWNVYDSGILLFKAGDYDHAAQYLELSLLVPGKKMLFTIANSLIYRQFFEQTFSNGFELRLNHARINAVLLLSAAFYLKQNYDMAELFAMKGATESGIKDPEPFDFYVGAVEMAKNNPKKALAYFDKAIAFKSVNPYVYEYAAEILKQMGRNQEALALMKKAKSFKVDADTEIFAYPKYLELKFY